MNVQTREQWVFWDPWNNLLPWEARHKKTTLFLSVASPASIGTLVTSLLFIISAATWDFKSPSKSSSASCQTVAQSANLLHDPKTKCYTPVLVQIWLKANISTVLSSLSHLWHDCTLTQKLTFNHPSARFPCCVHSRAVDICESNYKRPIKERLRHKDKEGAVQWSTFRALTLPPPCHNSSLSQNNLKLNKMQIKITAVASLRDLYIKVQ